MKPPTFSAFSVDILGATLNLPINVALFVRPTTPPTFAAARVMLILPPTVTFDPDAKFAPLPISPTIPPIQLIFPSESVDGLVASTETVIVPLNAEVPLNVVVSGLVSSLESCVKPTKPPIAVPCLGLSKTVLSLPTAIRSIVVFAPTVQESIYPPFALDIPPAIPPRLCSPFMDTAPPTPTLQPVMNAATYCEP